MIFDIHPFGTGPSNAAVNAKFKEIVIDAYKKRGYKVTPHGQGGKSLVKHDANAIIDFTSRILSTGQMEFWAHGVHITEVERLLIQVMADMPPYTMSLDQWNIPTCQLGIVFSDAPKPPSRAFESIEEAETMFRTYVAYMEATGFGIIDYHASIQNMNEELQRPHNATGVAKEIWADFGMGGSTKYCRALIISKLCNRHFDERLEICMKDINDLILEYASTNIGEQLKQMRTELESALPYIRQIQPIYHL
jgi:hypothetical protein